MGKMLMIVRQGKTTSAVPLLPYGFLSRRRRRRRRWQQWRWWWSADGETQEKTKRNEGKSSSCGLEGQEHLLPPHPLPPPPLLPTIQPVRSPACQASKQQQQQRCPRSLVIPVSPFRCAAGPCEALYHIWIAPHTAHSLARRPGCLPACLPARQPAPGQQLHPPAAVPLKEPAPNPHSPTNSRLSLLACRLRSCLLARLLAHSLVHTSTYTQVENGHGAAAP